MTYWQTTAMLSWLYLLTLVHLSLSIAIPSSPPSGAATVDPALLSVSLEFFTFPGYTQLPNTAQCLANIQTLRGTPPAVRIGGTTQDRATYNASEPLPVRYTVADPTLAPDTLTYGPSFFTLASQLKGDVTLGLNRRLNNENNTLAAAQQAVNTMSNIISIELGNEPEFYASGSPIIPAGQTWSPTLDAASQQKWHQDLRSRIGKPLGQAAVYLQPPTWSTAGLIPRISSALSSIVSFSGHSYPQSACGGASTNLPALQSHSGIVSYTSRYRSEAAAAHNAGKRYFLGETNSATCGGGGISPTFGAALWIIDYTIQAALVGVERLYFHQGTIANCAYCWWGQNIVDAPYYGVVFLSEALGTTGHTIAMLDAGTSTTAVYAIYTAAGAPVRVLIVNTAYFDGTGTRSSATVALSGITRSGNLSAKRLTAATATATVSGGAAISLGGQAFNAGCARTGTQVLEIVTVSGGAISVTLKASEALIVNL